MLLKLETLPRWLRDVVPLILWMMLIFVLSSRPVLLEIESEIGEKLFYKGAHMLTYATLAWLWWRALSPERQVGWSVLFTVVGLTTLYGVSDEIHQGFVPSRHSQLADVLFDAAGALAMILLIRRIRWLRLWPDNLGFSLIWGLKKGM